jgi:hypothetical protein
MEIYTLKDKKIKKKTIYLYFVLFFVFIFLCIQINNKNTSIILKGVVKNNIHNKFMFSEYNGLIDDVFISKNQTIKYNQKIYSIIIKDDTKIERENEIKYLNNLLKNEKNKKEQQKIQNELKQLQSVVYKKNIYSTFKENKIIQSIYINKNTLIQENKKLVKFKNKKNDFFIETYILPKNIKNIKVNQIVDVFFITNNIKYTGIIEKIYFDLYNTSDILKSSGIGKDNNSYKIKIKLTSEPNFIKEGLPLKIKINFKNNNLLLNDMVDYINDI